MNGRIGYVNPPFTVYLSLVLRWGEEGGGGWGRPSPSTLKE